jgi:hypothetical protein
VRTINEAEEICHEIQRSMHERVMHAPIFEPAALHGSARGSRNPKTFG